MIQRIGDCFLLQTKDTTYAFSIMETGHLQHLYYGRRITIDENSGHDAIFEKHTFQPGNAVQYDKEHANFSLEDMPLEMSTHGKGDIREPFVEIRHKDGSRTSDFVFDREKDTAIIGKGKKEMETLPGSYDETGEVDHLILTLHDRQYPIKLELHYYVYEKCNVITRYSKLINEGDDEISVLRLMSTQVDFDCAGFLYSTFGGNWAREMKRSDTYLSGGKHVNESFTGTSSSRANPFVMLSRPGAGENAGLVYGFNLIYSGNHYECAQVNGHGKTRFVSGMNPQSFEWVLMPGENLEAPEAVMSVSHEGYNGMSQNMHHFVKEHIVRGSWKHKERPVLLNSWEAAYFDINERKLVNLAKAGKEVGIELFVMDDGWFGNRNDDTQSLGDWDVNPKKLPNGLKGLADKINSLGMMFGIWVEPEMVNENSELFRQHPDWVLQIPGMEHSESRNQRMLDLCNPKVTEFIIEKMTQVFSSANISYVKWDMNRIMSDIYSPYLEPKRQGEVVLRYQRGLYHCMKELTKRFPDILFEGCSAGGNRFDLGILSYFPQIWGSDDTDAVCRCEIQTGYSYGYPLSCVSAHVSAVPNHQTLRKTPLETRFNIACFGSFGYECNLCDMRKEELEAIKKQVEFYKQYRSVMQTGDFYRGRTCHDASRSYEYGSVLAKTPGNVTEWTMVSQDKKTAVGMLMQRLVVPNWQYECFRASGLNPESLYHFRNRNLKINVKEFGDLVNTVSPVHIKQDSLMQDVVSRFVKMDGETEDCTAYGDTLMYCGVKLKASFGGTGYNSEVRHFQDFGSRLYVMETKE